jgi:Flp pilus assembly protein TadG
LFYSDCVMSNHNQKSTLSQDRTGSAIIEFAIIAPILFLFLIGFTELALIFFTNAVLEGATNIGSRIGRTGYTAGGVVREDYIRSEIQRLSGGYLDTSLLNISILSYDNFGNVGRPEDFIDANGNGTYDPGESFTDVNGNSQWDADRGITGAGVRGAVVLYRVTYPWELFTPLMRDLIGDPNGILNITAVATVRNERF